MTSIKRESPIPLYFQLKQLLAKRITSAELQPGDILPTEEQLQETYLLSRTTVRQALKELEIEGLVSRYRGRGTFVSQPIIRHSSEPHFSLTDALLQQGIQPSWHVLSAEWVPATMDVASSFELEPATPVFRLRRLRLTNDEPIGYHIALAAPSMAASIDKSQFHSGGSLRYLRGNDALNGSYANRTLEAVGASSEVSDLLDIEEGSPTLLIRRKITSRDGAIIEVLQAMYRGDRLQYQIRQGPDTRMGE
jgi:GntR family transcriptional regulator